jgi:hypothetical protein
MMSGTVFFAVKVAVSALLIAGVSELAKRLPGLGGLIAAMPLTTLLTLLWLYGETGDYAKAEAFTRSVFWGILPTLVFFVAALVLFRRGVPFYAVIVASFVLFLAAAALHQMVIGSR